MSDKNSGKSVSEMLTIPLDNLRIEERTRLLVALLDRSPIKHVQLEDLAPDFAIMLFAADSVSPGEIRSISMRSCLTWLATGLFVLEPEHERTDSTTTTTSTTVTAAAAWWRPWKKRTTTTTSRTVDSRVSSVRTPAEAWNLHYLYSGSKNVLTNPHPGPLPLSASLTPPPFEPFVAAVGIDIAIMASHNLQGPASFRALLVGHKVPEGRHPEHKPLRRLLGQPGS